MSKKYRFTLLWILVLIFFLNCKKETDISPSDPLIPDPLLEKAAITIDKSVKYQTIEGFGFFGAADVWWADAGSVWNDAWGEKVISDLGITMWRNEVYPPSVPGSPQDADWIKQKPVVMGLKAKADKYNVRLKFIATVWSPPADLKWECSFEWAGDKNATRNPGNVSTKNGGTLNPYKYPEFADWLKSNIRLYKEAGIDLYALSLQNELMFIEPYNSCTYTTSWYNEMVNAVVPAIKADFSDLKIYGAENMLEMEGKDNNWPYFYHSAIKANDSASENIDVLAVHGYSDGVIPSSGSELAKMWTNHFQQFSMPMNKQVWMTETSGYAETWEKSGTSPGALNLAMDLHAALNYGNISAWVWWQGSQSSIDEYSLMNGTITGKKYSVSKHFYRYIRPGAERQKCTITDTDVLVTAYEHKGNGTTTIIIINSGGVGKDLSFTGDGLPAAFKMYRTNSGSENCTYIRDVNPGEANSFTIPAKSIVTLQAGGDSL